MFNTSNVCQKIRCDTLRQKFYASKQGRPGQKNQTAGLPFENAFRSLVIFGELNDTIIKELIMLLSIRAGIDCNRNEIFVMRRH